MSNTWKLLDRLEGVKKTGSDRWIAKCPSHSDKNPSLSIREGEKGTLVTCFAGCSFQDIIAAVGLSAGELFHNSHEPEDGAPSTYRTPEYDWRNLLIRLRGSLSTIQIYASHVAVGNKINEDEIGTLIDAILTVAEAIDTAESTTPRAVKMKYWKYR